MQYNASGGGLSYAYLEVIEPLHNDMKVLHLRIIHYLPSRWLACMDDIQCTISTVLNLSIVH